MISGKTLTAMARKWRRKATSSRGMISLLSDQVDKPFVADKGHFVVYTTDGKRFMVPLSYLDSSIFQGLFKMSEEVFGFSCNGPIRVPCDAAAMEYAVPLIGRGLAGDLEKALLNIVVPGRCTVSSTASLGPRPQVLVY
ncbi:hypothetical protein SAY86_009987 [Trapa natans]|uniref:Uncharacterized protein n=1 Tax=Trapa natans TaxID=22666 RepID=A0AAN7QQQ4_TRANT|nr:hypothetical protein SAY86_009987 [Trapa natans]